MFCRAQVTRVCGCAVTVTGFRSGSIIIDFRLSVVVNTDVNSVYDVIVEAIENDEILPQFTIESSSLSVTDPGTSSFPPTTH